MRTELHLQLAGGNARECSTSRSTSSIAEQRIAAPDRHGAGGRGDVGDVPALADRDSETAPLADGERVDAVVLADDRAGLVDDGARRGADARAEERVAPAAGDEADVHALALVGGAQAERAGAVPHLGLRQLADREQHARELVGSEHVQHVRLVLGRVDGARERGTVVGRDDPGVVAGRDELVVEPAGPFEHAAELHRAIALDARIRRLAGRVRATYGSTTSWSKSSEKLKT